MNGVVHGIDPNLVLKTFIHTLICVCTYIKSFSIIFNLVYTHPKMFNVITLEW